METAVHAHVELTAATSHNKLSVVLVAHFTLELTIFDLLELASALMLAVISIAKLLLRADDTTLALCRSNIGGSRSVYNLLGASRQILFNPEIATALPWSLPLCTTLVAEFSSAFAII